MVEDLDNRILIEILNCWQSFITVAKVLNNCQSQIQNEIF